MMAARRSAAEVSGAARAAASIEVVPVKWVTALMLEPEQSTTFTMPATKQGAPAPAQTHRDSFEIMIHLERKGRCRANRGAAGRSGLRQWCCLRAARRRRSAG